MAFYYNNKKLKRISLEKKTGFRNSTGAPVVIVDENGLEFYNTNDCENTVWNFNLPKGVFYIVTGKIVETVLPVEYPMSKFPPPEKNERGNPDEFELKFVENPEIATIFFDARKIIMDNSLKDVPFPTALFVLYHEHAHKFYNTEEYCDLWARNKMLNEGYNPSQIIQGVRHTLGNNNLSRQITVMNSLTA